MALSIMIFTDYTQTSAIPETLSDQSQGAASEFVAKLETVGDVWRL